MLIFFSEELKSKREEAGLTIQQIASKTRIDKKYIELLEQGNFSFLPELYVKSFIREYAMIVGIDPEETIKKYHLAKEGKNISINVEEQNSISSEIIEKTKTDRLVKESKSKSFIDENVAAHSTEQNIKKNNTLIIISSIVSTVFLIFILYLFFTSKEEIIIEETPFKEIRNQDDNRYIEESVTSSDSLSLEIYSKDTTWIYLILDKKDEEEFILYPNRKRMIKTTNVIEGTIGNSGSIIMKLNDKNLDFIGRKNLPRHFRVDKTFALEYLNSRPILNTSDVR
jgi:cytoskeletal protein RodZ